MATDPLILVTLSVILGTLAAIVYSLRVLIILERRVARMELHLEKMAGKIIQEEYTLERRFGAKKRRKR